MKEPRFTLKQIEAMAKKMQDDGKGPFSGVIQGWLWPVINELKMKAGWRMVWKRGQYQFRKP